MIRVVGFSNRIADVFLIPCIIAAFLWIFLFFRKKNAAVRKYLPINYYENIFGSMFVFLFISFSMIKHMEWMLMVMALRIL